MPELQRSPSLAAACLSIGLAFGCSVLVHCGGAAVRPDNQDRLDPAVLFPLTNDAAWSYDVDTGEGINTLAISKVVVLTENRVEFSTGGKDTLVYQRDAQGLRRGGEDRWLLRAPIHEGASWPSPVGTATVVGIHETVDTKAGRFKQCVRVQEKSEDGFRKVETVYCPHVGPVIIDSQMHMKLADRNSRVVARLLGFRLESN